MPNFRRFIVDFGLAGRVRRLGVLTDEEKRYFYAGIDVFALPSRSDSFGLVFLEAWANGVPNIAYRAGGPAELVRPGQDGELARCGDVQDLTAVLGRLVGDAAYRRMLGDTGRCRIRREFRWAEKLQLVSDTLREVATQPPERREADGRAIRLPR
jgi:L-malate glycosyltransferase